VEGTGLGLSIVKKCIEMLKGDISFESEAGKGTIFHVSVPVS
jgi:signal transduction histidine kinase